MKMSNEERVIAFFEKQLSQGEEKQLLSELKSSAELNKLYEAYQDIYAVVDDQEVVKPSAESKERFESFIQQHEMPIKDHEIPQNRGGKRITLQLLSKAAVILMLVGVGLGLFITNKSKMNQMRNEMAMLKSDMTKLLNNESTSMRIKAVNMTTGVSDASPEILSALIHTMNTDESENVKLASIDALEKFAHENIVRVALIEALGSQESDYVRIKLINILAKLKATEALPLFDTILNNENTSPFVKSEALRGSKNIKSI